MGLTRSQNMAKIRATDTSPEKILRRELWSNGLRYRVHLQVEGVKTDLAFPKHRIAVFVDGCFWHGCPEHYVRPRSRGDFWSSKLRENVERDRRQTLKLERRAWQVCRFWEHEIFEDLSTVLDRVTSAVRREYSSRDVEWRVVSVVPIDEAGDYENRVLESLRDPTVTKRVEQKRHTRKWRGAGGA